MILTQSFIGIKKGDYDYLFFYITEPYIQKQLEARIDPLLGSFARALLGNGAVVKAFDIDIEKVNSELIDNWDAQNNLISIISFRDNTRLPGLLIINKDFSDFSPKVDQWLYVSFRENIDDFGNVEIFELQKMLNAFAEICNSNGNLFEEATKYINKNEAIKARKILEIKPGIFGVSIDIKEAMDFIQNWKNRYKRG